MTPWCRWGAPPVGADVPVERSSMASAYLGGAACVEPAGEGRGLHRSGLWTGVLVRDGGRVMRFVEGWADLGGRRRCIHCLGMQCDGGGQASQVTPVVPGWRRGDACVGDQVVRFYLAIYRGDLVSLLETSR